MKNTMKPLCTICNMLDMWPYRCQCYWRYKEQERVIRERLKLNTEFRHTEIDLVRTTNDLLHKHTNHV